MNTFGYDLPFGAQLLSDARTRFRIWAPNVDKIAVEVKRDKDRWSDSDRWESHTLRPEENGYWRCDLEVDAGTAYRYRLPDDLCVPDPASRLQEDDVHGPSIVVNPAGYEWQQPEWRGRRWTEMVIYEIHPGCWGGFKGIERRLDYLAELGITAIELMPIADFPGQRSWGYDGVLPFAPDRSYGTPDELKHLIDAAHARNLCVYLDVVYNHFGPDGNYLHTYAEDFFDHSQSSPWGVQIDFTQIPVREFFTHNALFWLGEYRFDGLRFDAVHAINEKDWLDEMAARVRSAYPDRHIHLMLENERNQVSHLEGHFDAQWNDDGHNVLHVLLTGEREGYYRNYADKPTERLARMLDAGFVYQGEPSPLHGNKPRGEPSGHIPPFQFVLFLQNHDQVGNRAYGERLTTLCDRRPLRAAIALQLLSPQIPLLFMDEERASTTPFLFFTDFHGELAAAVRDGRRREFQAFSAFNSPEAQAHIPDPNAEETFLRSASFRAEDSDEQQASYAFYRRLLDLRKQIVVPGLAQARSCGAAVLGEGSVLARWDLPGQGVLAIYVNLGQQDRAMQPAQGRLLFESTEGAADQAKSGRLAAYATCAFLENHEPNQE